MAFITKSINLASTIIFIFFICTIQVVANETQNAQASLNHLDRQTLKAVAEASTGFSDEFDAQVWMVDMDKRLKRYVKDEKVRTKILKEAHKNASKHELSPQLVLSVMHVESLFDHFALSHAGARGIMQIMPFWRAELDRPDANLFDIQTNIEFGTIILKTYLRIEKGNLTRALARYNGSLGKTWYPERVYKAHDRFWSVVGEGI